jgi:predicted TIM-barrel enzyme
MLENLAAMGALSSHRRGAGSEFEEPMMKSSRSEILARFREKVAQGKPIIGGGAGTGISAKSEEAGGIDLIVIYNSGRFRMAGRGSLAGMMPYGNANQIVREMAPEVLTAVDHTPVLAGVCGTDPFLLRDRFLRELRGLGFAGVQNFPTMAEAGADIVVAHMGLTTGGTIGARTAKTLDQCLTEVQAIAEASKAVRSGCLVLCHGGPIANPEDARYILERCPGIEGFYGASSMERLPAETAIAEQVRRFTGLTLRG